MDCKSIQEKLSVYIEDIISSEEKAVIDEHLRSCQKCSGCLADLMKTLDYVKNIEEVEPPQWITTNVMAKVKAEADTGKGIFERLCYPLHIKLPIEAVAVVLIALTTIYIFKTIQPEIRLQDRTELAKAPSEEVINERLISQGDKKRGKDLMTSSPLLKEKELKPSPTFAQSDREKVLLYEKDKEESVPEEASETKAAESLKKAEAEGQAPGAKRDEVKKFSGAAERYESRREALSAFETKAKGDMKKEIINLTLSVRDVETASEKVEEVLIQFGGKAINKDNYENKNILNEELYLEKIDKLIEKLKMLGEVKQEEKSFESHRGSIKIRISIE